MANYKADVQKKLENEKEQLYEKIPEFLYIFLEEILPSQSNELRSHIAVGTDILVFLRYISENVINKEVKEICTLDLDKLTLMDFNNFFRYITSYKVNYIDRLGNSKIQVRTNSQTSKARKLSSLKKLFNYLESKGLIHHNYIKEMKIKKPNQTKIDNRLNKVEVYELKDLIDEGKNICNERQQKAFERLKVRDLTIFMIFAYTGIRVSELVSLDITDVNTNKCTLKVVRKGNKIQEIPYPEEVSNYLNDYLKYREQKHTMVSPESKKALFLSQQNRRITDKAVRNLLQKYAKRANIDEVTCHTLRRTFLSNLYNSTQDIKLTAKIGGHSVTTASTYYADVDEERYIKEIKKFSY